VRVVHLTLNDCGAAGSADDFCDRQPQLLRKNHLDSFYSRARLINWTAKKEYVEPDLAFFIAARGPE